MKTSLVHPLPLRTHRTLRAQEQDCAAVQRESSTSPQERLGSGREATTSPSPTTPPSWLTSTRCRKVSGLDVTMISLPELRQIEDALTSLKLTVEGLLTGCKSRLGV